MIGAICDGVIYMLAMLVKINNILVSSKKAKPIQEELHEMNLMMREKRRVKISSL